MERCNIRFMVDFYGIRQDVAEDSVRVFYLLRAVNDELFDGRGTVTTIPVLDKTKKPENNGISGILNAPGGHFTIHTFSCRSVAFVDLFKQSGLSKDNRRRLIQFVKHSLGGTSIDVCQSSTLPSFGTHCVLRLRDIPLALALPTISTIVERIGMRPLSECQILTQGADYDIIQPITESHIAAHRHGGNLYLDVFSCKPFGATRLVRILQNEGIWVLDEATISRGSKMKNQRL